MALNVNRFFSGDVADKNGQVFASANYSGTNFEQRLGNHTKYADLDKKLIKQLMTQQGYDRPSNANAKPDDLHHNFVDFVVHTARFHRAIDVPTGRSMGYNALAPVLMAEWNNIPGIDAPLNYAAVAGVPDHAALRDLWSRARPAPGIIRLVAVAAARNAAGDNLAAILAAIAAYNHASVTQPMKDWVAANVPVGTAPADVENVIRNNAPFEDVGGAGYRFPTTLLPVAQGTDLNDALQRYARAVGAASQNDHIFADGNNWSNVTADNLRDAFSALIGTTVSARPSVQQQLDKMNAVVPDAANRLTVNDVSAAIARAISGALDTLVQNARAAADLAALDAVIRLDSAAPLTEAARDAVSQRFRGVGVAPAAGNNVNHRALLENVFKAAKGTVNLETTKFYKAFLNVIGANGNVWSFDQLGDPAASMNQPGANLANYRVNLRKFNNDPTKTIFGETLPLAQVGSDAWYTDGMGQVVSERIADSDYLSKLYKKIYREEQGHGNYRVQQNAVQFEAGQALVRNMIRNNTDSDQALKRHRASSPPGTLPPTPLDDLFDNSPMVELATGKVWKRDGEGLYKVDANGKKLYAHKSVKELEQNGTKCYSIGGIAPADCGKLLKCLVDGDSKALGTCLDDVYADVDMFKAAKNDVDATHPNMAVFVLKKFGFKADKKTSGGVTFKRCQSVDSWLAGKSVSADEKKAIDGNEALKDYLKGLVHWINSEPAILNKHLTGDKPSAGDSRPEMFKNLELCQYTEPVERKGRMSFTAGLLANAAPIRAPVLGLHFGNRINPATNAVFGFPQYGRGEAMAGGCMTGGAQVSSAFVENLVNRRSNDGTVGCVDTYRALVDSTVNDLNSMGYKLDGNDMNKITDSLAQLQNLENKLRKLNGILSDFVTISDAWGMDYRAAGKGDRTVPLDQINNSADMERYLNATMDELKKSINNNMNLQAMGANNMQQTAANMINKVVGLEDDV